MKPIFTAVACILFSINTNAQSRYIIKLKDKGGNPFSIANPSQYLSQRALQRRSRYNILIDSLDLPVTPRYIDSIRLAGAVTILNTSKWLNQVTIKTTDAAALSKINSFSFVVNAVAVAAREGEQEVAVNKMLNVPSTETISTNNSTTSTEKITADVFSYGASHGQVHLHEGEFLHNHGFKGEGMQLSLLDAGYYHYLTLPTFDSIRLNNQIINVWDFVENNASVDEDFFHGMTCLSTIAANIPGVFVGTAPKAGFCLFRTEDVATETRIEEHNLAAGYERADSIGVDVCSVSLGYTTFDNAAQNYTYANMNGNTTMSAIASNIAAKKGMLPIVAAGNDGAGAWRYISTPADADSVMAVGAVDTLGNVANFSSYGPTSNGKVKPSVAATGLRAVVANTSTGLPTFGNGTSYATPNIAGLTTCLWQAFPEYNNMAILDAMQRSASRFTNPDDRIGYGIPNMKKAFSILLKKSYTKNACLTNNIAAINIRAKFDNSMKVIIERKQSNQTAFTIFKTINGTGNFSLKDINFTENFVPLQNIIVSYRVKLEIGTDTSFYLDEFDVNQNQTCLPPVDEIKINPNPVVDVANIMITRSAASSKITIVVVKATGQTIYKTTYDQTRGTQIKMINMKNNEAGVYYVTVYADDKKLGTLTFFKK